MICGFILQAIVVFSTQGLITNLGICESFFFAYANANDEIAPLF